MNEKEEDGSRMEYGKKDRVNVMRKNSCTTVIFIADN